MHACYEALRRVLPKSLYPQNIHQKISNQTKKPRWLILDPKEAFAPPPQ